MSVAEILKKAREEKKLTLKEISAKTKISEKFLEKIENGTFDFAPEPYVRAFLRSYARVVGLNPDEVIKLYDSEISALKPKESIKEEKEKIQFDFASFVSENILWLIGGALVILLAIFIFIGVGREEKKEVRKKSFETAVEEISKANEIPMEKKEMKIEPDSLELKIIASDSVWFNVLVDSAQAKEFLMPPNTSLTLKARNNFNFTIGNAGGVKFILNGNELEPIGRKGLVVRNYVIDREKLKSLTLHR
ncbi:helix-turn-helix domain-containing protein [Candidatus Chrysopegis kryptomonas]|uniref:HTH cro/C1-type domain-containing protein n=1 Tax=Candidatus Chryseopegocella kryptomonas TaxID=1633643 RepID=A0A0P1MJY6_9BACT|nr:helix-turn-helix domain-containing protein [Candidatus Chrysopegis kryptomonas]CUS95998.1 protein of unknown function (DUF4115) [Candidatus Chrysopegis kryptomonas]